jgi:ADP-heptose:LPS heptosyltransferase
VFLLRPDNLGDVVLFSGALKHIRSYFSQAEITLCVQRRVHNYVELCPHIDRIVFWEDLVRDLARRPTLDWIPDIRGKWRLEQGLRAIMRSILREKYRSDIVLLPVRSPRAGEYGMHEMVRRIPARKKYGIAGDCSNQKPESDKEAESIYTSRLFLAEERMREHELQITREFLSFIGIDVELHEMMPDYWLDSSDKEWATQSIGLDSSVVNLALCPGVSSSPMKKYPARRIAEAIGMLDRANLCAVIFGGANEVQDCQVVEELLSECSNIVRVINLCGRSTIRQLIGGLKLCDVVLSQDTAALHLAVALGKPTVGILGGGHHGRFYPWGDAARNRVADKLLDCHWCNWRCKFDTIRCITEIAPERIALELRYLIERLPNSQYHSLAHALPNAD